jgi:hypothetical protein
MGTMISPTEWRYKADGKVIVAGISFAGNDATVATLPWRDTMPMARSIPLFGWWW